MSLDVNRSQNANNEDMDCREWHLRGEQSTSPPMSSETQATQATDRDVQKQPTPQQEPYPTPLVSAAHVDINQLATRTIPHERAMALETVAERIADGWAGDTRDHHVGLLGEDAVAQFFGIPDALNTEVYADGGDGGVDLLVNGATVDVKTVGRRRSNPALTVDVYEQLTADYYALASRIGERTVRLIGYAPREFVANARKFEYGGDTYHVVEQEYLFPFVDQVGLDFS